MQSHRIIFRLLVLVAACSLAGCDAASSKSISNGKSALKLTNVSYDPTRELYAEFNKEFARHWQEEHEQVVEILEMPDLYPQLERLITMEQLDEAALVGRAELLRDLLAEYVVE